MRPHITAGLIGLLAGALPGGYAVFHKPAPIIERSQAIIVSRATPDSPISRAEQRQIDAAWGELAQKEIDDLTAALKALPKSTVVIFCADDRACGDIGLDFDNAFESDHWETRLEKPLIDSTVGIVTTREDLRDAINKATSGRLNVQFAPPNTAAWDYLAIGKKVALKK